MMTTDDSLDTEYGIAQDEVCEAGKRLAAARLSFAKQFQIQKASRVTITDKMAEQMAIEASGDEVTIRQTDFKVAMLNLERLSR